MYVWSASISPKMLRSRGRRTIAANRELLLGPHLLYLQILHSAWGELKEKVTSTTGFIVMLGVLTVPG